MVTVIQQPPGNAFTDVLGALHTVLSTIQANRERAQVADLLKAKLLEGQGTFQPAPPAQQSWLDSIFGGTSAPDQIRIAGSTYQFRPFPALGTEGARALDLTYPETRTIAPGAPLTALDDTAAGYAIGR